MNSGSSVDKSESLIRFICGSVFGAVVSVFAWTNFGAPVGPSIAIGITFLCGYLAFKHGDRFWYKVADWWGIYR